MFDPQMKLAVIKMNILKPMYFGFYFIYFHFYFCLKEKKGPACIALCNFRWTRKKCTLYPKIRREISTVDLGYRVT